MITAEFINEVHDALIPHFRDIPFGNAAWSTFYDDEDYGHFRLRLALCYGSTFKYETFDEGDDDSRTLDEVVEEWKQAIIEATTTNLIDYKGGRTCCQLCYRNDCMRYRWQRRHRTNSHQPTH